MHFLDRYGMRCAGEIDITNLVGEKPAMLVPCCLKERQESLSRAPAGEDLSRPSGSFGQRNKSYWL